MYRRPKFLEVLLDIRREMAHEADYDVDLFAEMVRSGHRPAKLTRHSVATAEPETNNNHSPRHSTTRGRIRKTRVR